MLPEFQKALAEIHSHEVPEIIALDASAVTEPYRAWLLNRVARQVR